MYKKILLPVDGREGAWRAIRAATQAAKICSGEILLLHVEPPVSQLISGKERKALNEEFEMHGKGNLQPVHEFLLSKNIPHRLIVCNGSIADSIVKTAHDESVDLIVMFTDGVSNLSEMVFGSITQRVIKDIDIDLLSIRK